MSPPLAALFISTIGLGTIVTSISSHWVLAWLGLEINSAAILPVMARHSHPRAIEATTKYFIVQATGAAMVLFAACLNAWLNGEWVIEQSSPLFIKGMAVLGLALKLGIAPLHFWLPDVLQGLDLRTGLFISTWQKLAPLILLIQLGPCSNLLTALGLACTLIGGWSGLNQVYVRKILAYSSVAHMGWMVVILHFSYKLTLIAFLVYAIMTITAFLVCDILKATSINSLATSWAKCPSIVALAPLTLFSLAGLPPLSGFTTKLLIIQELTGQGLLPLATLMAISALLSLHFYLRLVYALTLTVSPAYLTAAEAYRVGPTNHSIISATFAASTVLLLPLTPVMTSLVF